MTRDDASKEVYDTFIGKGWSFPPEFVSERGAVTMSEGEDDIDASLRVLFGTVVGERFLQPKYGLDMQSAVFEPMSTTMRTFLKDRIKTTILIYEPRINVLSLEIESPDPNSGCVRILLEYEIRSTNSRYNLVYPFYTTDSSEVSRTVAPEGA